MIRALSRTEVAELIGVKPTSLSRADLPEPDVMIGDVRGWMPETVEEWDAQRVKRPRRRTGQPARDQTD